MTMVFSFSCWSRLGMQGGMQKLSLADGCRNVTVLLFLFRSLFSTDHVLPGEAAPLAHVAVEHEVSKHKTDLVPKIAPKIASNIKVSLNHVYCKKVYDRLNAALWAHFGGLTFSAWHSGAWAGTLDWISSHTDENRSRQPRDHPLGKHQTG